LIILLLILTLVQCKKENTSEEGKPFVIGEYNPLRHTRKVFNPAKEVYTIPHSYDNMKVDVDKDGINDFDLISNHPVSPGGVSYCYAAIEPLNANIEIFYTDITDTIFECNKSSSSGGDSVVWIVCYNSVTLYECQGHDTILLIEQVSFPQKWEYGNILGADNKWTNEEINLAIANSSSTYGIENNIIYYWEARTKLSNWNGLPAGYLLFRIKTGNYYKYGWIKLEVFDDLDFSCNVSWCNFRIFIS